MIENKRTQFLIRFLLALTAGLAIAGVGLNVTWRNAAGHAPDLQRYTRSKIEQVNDDIKAYRKKNGKLPASLDVLIEDPEDFAFNDKTNPMLFDAWLRPLEYKVNKNSYGLISYGRDAKPGGVGLDCDISINDMHPAGAKSPFLQVITDPWAFEMVKASAVSGIITFFLIFLLVRPQDLSQHRWGCLILKLVPTLYVAAIIATIITALDYPSGH